MTCRPQPPSIIIAATTTAAPSRRTFLTSATARTTAAALLCAFALHLAFPLTGWWWLAPFAFAGLFASWWSLPPRSALFAGYASGLVFFTFGFSWFGETAGSLLGPAAPLLDLAPAAVEALAFALAAWLTSLAARRCDARLVPFAAAAAFALCEALRSTGVLGVPLEHIGIAAIDSPLRPLAAYAGVYGLTFAIALLGATLGWALLRRGERAPALVAAACWAAIPLCTALAWLAWPARHHAPPFRRVAVVQGGIAQSIKRSDEGLGLALVRYASLTRELRGAHASLVLWPETVITTDLARAPALRAQFAALASEIGATLYAGGFWDDGKRLENALVIFDPRVSRTDTSGVYLKEQLVPFAEWLPGPAWLRALPFADQIGGFMPGRNLLETRDGATPLICWESMFGDIAHRRLADNPSLLLVATDDAWFGTTEFPYEHAQAATLRAVETGRWVLQAGATGISGIVAPDGTWTTRSALGGQAVLSGDVGAPAPPPYARIGPIPVTLALALVAALPFLRTRRRSA